MAKRHKPATTAAPRPKKEWEPTDDDPACECGAAKHEHMHGPAGAGTGGYAGDDATIECDEFVAK